MTGVDPIEFHARWDIHDSTELSLCARKTCIIIKNWCQSIRHRLYRMEFIFNYDQRPIIIQHMYQFDCHYDTTDVQHDRSIIKLNKKFFNAHKQLLLANKNHDNDDYRLMQCIGTSFVDVITRKSMYKLFGYSSIIDQINYMHDNCIDLFTTVKLKNLSFATMNTTFADAIKKFQLDDTTIDEYQTAELLGRKFAKLTNQCWQRFKLSLSNLSDVSEQQKDGGTLFRMIDQRVRLLVKCV